MMRCLVLLALASCGPPPPPEAPAPPPPAEAVPAGIALAAYRITPDGEQLTHLDQAFAPGTRLRLAVRTDRPAQITVFEEVGPGQARRIMGDALAPGIHPLGPVLAITPDPAPTALVVIVGPPATDRSSYTRARAGAEAPRPADGAWAGLGPRATLLPLHSDAAHRPRPTGDPCTDCRMILNRAKGTADLQLRLAADDVGVKYLEPRLTVFGADGAPCAKATLEAATLPGAELTHPQLSLDGCGAGMTPKAIVTMTRVGPDGSRSEMEGTVTVKVSDW